MNPILNALSAVTMTIVAYPAFANPLDLSNSIKSIDCRGSHASLVYDASAKAVALTTSNESKLYNVTSLKKTTQGLQLVAQSPVDQLHLVATVRANGGRSLVQHDGTYFYARCEVK